ncbi:MAG: sigma-54-dependent Fis family transcriptional regulator [Deltaproteobacteria bacterium]|nr:MAG: sigma-54-dependent Fis family transcriptional regulator [Deltaproteobacteria bacterium]TMQ25332.1 MAG: sigma-54-dependent Fis family transcriptional regulator [Deltaproteobacteria bacterium]
MSGKPWIGVSDAHRRLLELIERVAPTDVELLFYGETGVGKEHYARYAHDRSPRHQRPFVPVNCGSIPAELFENELFGHVGGAFTGARTRAAGLIEAAEDGTLFFDEVDALAPANQVKLLRLLQQKEYRRLGDTRAQHTTARIVAATNRDLVSAARAGRFRDDLLFRLRVVPVTVPPLRERRDDILPLLDAFTAWYASAYGLATIAFTAEARARLRDYGWPGNVREVENLVRHLTCVHPGALVDAAELPLLGDPAGGPAGSFKHAKSALVAEFERKFLEDALEAADGNIARAARLSGKPRRAFFALMRKHGVIARR